MRTRREWLGGAAVVAGVAALGGRTVLSPAHAVDAGSFPVQHTDAEWRRLLTPGAYQVLRQQGTEFPGSSPLDHQAGAGRYSCAGCDRPLFDAATKFDSGTGWPSFYQPLADAVGTSSDTSFFGQRTEVHCAGCGGHLGHVFSDGPRPTGLRYCMNGVALRFHAA